MRTITVHVGGHHLYMTYIYTGLLRLEREGSVSVSFVKRSASYGFNDYLLLAMDVSLNDQTVKVLFDLADSQSISCQRNLDLSDLCFKRNYNPQSLPESKGRDKVLPFGLLFPCRYRVRGQAIRNLLSSTLGTGNYLGSAKERLGQWYNYWRLPELNNYEEGLGGEGERYVLFQTRAWNPGNYENWEEINRSRAKLIRTLKRRFTKQFIGGFMPDAFAKKYYPDAVTQFPSSRRAYVSLIRNARVCVYSRGLFNSPAFKMGEYLACGRCIVAEPLSNQLPELLRHGQHYLSYSSAEECADHCQQLLDDPNLAKHMRQENMLYYRCHVEPSRQMQRVIDLAVKKSSNAPSAYD